MSADILMVWLTVLTFLLMWASNKYLWQASYGLLFVVGLATSTLTFAALGSAISLIVLLVIYQQKQRFSLLSVGLALVLGVLLGLHQLPGFNNYQFASDIVLSDTSVAFDIWFNFDKSMFGLFVLGIVLHRNLIRNVSDAVQTLTLFMPVAVVGLLAIYIVGIIIGYSSFDWTFSSVFFAWALKNMVFTVVAEEVFFRGIVQYEISKRLQTQGAELIAVIVAGILFGIAHFGGGLSYVLLSSLAGILYGYTYKVSGKIEAPIITHFLLNAGHFLIFTYPYSAP